MFDTAFVLLVIAALLAVVGFCQPLAAHLRLPPPVLLGVVGVALGGFPVVSPRPLLATRRWDPTSFNIMRTPERVMAQTIRAAVSSSRAAISVSRRIFDFAITFRERRGSTSTGLIVHAPMSWRGYLSVPEKSAAVSLLAGEVANVLLPPG